MLGRIGLWGDSHDRVKRRRALREYHSQSAAPTASRSPLFGFFDPAQVEHERRLTPSLLEGEQTTPVRGQRGRSPAPITSDAASGTGGRRADERPLFRRREKQQTGGLAKKASSTYVQPPTGSYYAVGRRTASLRTSGMGPN